METTVPTVVTSGKSPTGHYASKATLVSNNFNTDESLKQLKPPQKRITGAEIYCVALLLVINLANYGDRYTVPSVLELIREAFDVQDDMILGLLNTAFVTTYMLFSPLFGYLGDRYNRRLLMAVGLFIWACSSIASAFVNPEWPGAFWIFLTLRAIIGTGEASYITISPTIISDYFVGKRRTVILLIYQSTMLIGSGVGYMMASYISKASGSWHYAFMFWPPIVFLAMIGLIFLKEPVRGKAEGTTDLQATSYFKDMAYLMKVKSYISCTLGFTMTVFVVGGLSFWAPSFAVYMIKLRDPDADTGLVGFIFGVITILGGVTGAVSGTILSKFFRKFKFIGNSNDALACAIGALVSGPLCYLTLMVAKYSGLAMWTAMFFSMSFLSVNMVLTQEITLYVIIPSRRASGSGFQILISHLLGDAISPYIIGFIVDMFKFQTTHGAHPREPNGLENFLFRQHSLLFLTVICALGAFFYFVCALYVGDDKKEAKSLAYSMSRHVISAKEVPELVLTESPPSYTTNTSPSTEFQVGGETLNKDIYSGFHKAISDGELATHF